MTVDTTEPTKTSRQRWSSNIELLDEHIELEGKLLFRLGLGSMVVCFGLLVATSVYATKIGAIISVSVLGGLWFLFFKSWYVLVGIIHDREEAQAKLDQRLIVSFTPTILKVASRPRTFSECAWPGIFVVPQALMLTIATVGVTFHLAAGRTLFSGLSVLGGVVVPAVLMGSAAIAGGLIAADRNQ